MNTQAEKTSCDKLESISDVCQRTSMGKTFIYTQVAAGKFPKPIKIGTRSLFVAAEVTAWINERVAESREGE